MKNPPWITLPGAQLLGVASHDLLDFADISDVLHDLSRFADISVVLHDLFRFFQYRRCLARPFGL
jgi:hypothetical protein